MLGKHAPPVLYGCGDIGLANRSGIAMVGSRSIDAETEAYAVDLAQWVVSEGLTVFSGGAKGIDQGPEKAAFVVTSSYQQGGTWTPEDCSTVFCVVQR